MAVNTVNGMAYIGQTVQSFPLRKAVHLRARRDMHFHRAVLKYGADAFGWRVLVSDVPLSQLDTQERFWIRFYGTFEAGYNQSAGGRVNPHSSETRARMSASASNGRRHSSAVRSKIRESLQTLADRGELPIQQNPEVAIRMWQTRRRLQREALREAGQQVLFEDEE